MHSLVQLQLSLILLVSIATIGTYHLIVLFVLGIRVGFESTHYPGPESAKFIVVSLKLSGGISAYPFNVTVTASEQSPVSAEGINFIIIM